jgi:cytoskeleton-associated protein 5
VIVKTACEYLQKAVSQTYIDDLKKMCDSLCPNLGKLANHQDGELRSIGLATLGLFKGRIGDSIDKYLGDLNPQKLEKVKEAAGEYQLTKFDKPKNPPKKKASQKEEAKAEISESDAMAMDVGPPKKKKKKAKGPPSSFFERQQKMEGKAKEKLEEIKAEVTGVAPPKGAIAKKESSSLASETPEARPQTAQPTRKKAKIVIDESGPGVLKEEADGIITENCSAAILKQFNEAKWQDKVEAYSKFGAWLIEQEYSNEIFEAAFWYIKIKQKEFKEKNVNLVKAALNCISDVIKDSSGMSKRAATILLPFLSENTGDAKYTVLSKENLLSLSELVSPGFIVKGCCKHASSAKSPNVLVENNTVIKSIIDEFGPQGLPVQDMINYGIICCDNKNVKIRNETISMLSTLYKHLGEGIRKFLKDIKDSTLAVINSEFDKITPYQKGEYHSKREIINEEVKQDVEGGAGAEDPLESLPRTDVGKELGGQKLVTMINDKQWKKRKEAVDKMDAILEKANCRILPNGLSEVVGLLKVKMADSNKSVSKAFIQFVGKFAEALGPGAKQYAPMLIKPLLRCLSEKNTLVRNINMEAINKWSAAIGPENIINHIGKVIEKDNPEIRLVLLEWMLEHKKDIPNCESASFPKPLIECLQDKAPAIRGAAEKVMVEILPLSGPGPFKKLMKDLKPAVQNSIKPLIEK